MADNTRDPIDSTNPRSTAFDDDLNRENLSHQESDVEREGVESRGNGGSDTAARGRSSEPTDPDSAESENDRDDMISD